MGKANHHHRRHRRKARSKKGNQRTHKEPEDPIVQEEEAIESEDDVTLPNDVVDTPSVQQNIFVPELEVGLFSFTVGALASYLMLDFKKRFRENRTTILIETKSDQLIYPLLASGTDLRLQV